MGNGHVYWLATVLTVLGLGLSLYLVAQLVKRLADPKPDQQRDLAGGHDPDPIKVCEAAVRVLALAQTPARMPRGTRLTLHSR